MSAIDHLPAPDLVHKALWFAWFTIVYNLVEGFAAIGFGAAEESIALLGFGLDSWIEVSSAVVVLWRLRAETGAGSGSKARERRATMIIGALLIALAVSVLGGSVLQLATGSRPDTTLPGAIIAVLSLSFMFWLYRSKLAIAQALDSRTLRADAMCSRSCLQLSFVLLGGSLVYLVAPGLWWADGVAAIALAGLIAREGLENVREARKPEFSGSCCGCSD